MVMGKWRSRRWAGVLIAGVAVTGGGCNRQDAECLGRIGTLLLHRAEGLKQSGATGQLPLPGIDALGDTGESGKKVETRIDSGPGQ
jgi:hypothetical protein